MPTYIMLSTLTPEGVQTIKNNPQRIREVNKEIEQLGATVKAQWATLGRFDFVNVVEAPDEQTMARVSLELGSRGTVRYETLAAIPVDDFIASLSEGSRRRRAAGASTRSSARSCARRSAPRCCARPGNPGIARDARVLDVAVDDVAGLAAAAARRGASTSSSSGPEAPLVDGLVDLLAARGIAAFGPTPRGRPARGLQGLRQGDHGGRGRGHRDVAGGRHRRGRDGGDRALPGRAQVRRPGCRQGRGHRRGRGAGARGAQEFLVDERFGAGRVVVEEALEGEELSLLALCDGETAVPMAPAQDYKRIFDGDLGPNTGGMGSYSPVPGIDRAARGGVRAHDPPAGGRRAAPPRHAVPRLPVRGADAHGRRAARARVQRALRRSRDPGRAAAAALATCSTCSSVRRCPAGWSATTPSGTSAGR